jgi:hypothetical protein
MGSVALGLPITVYEEMRKYLTIYDEAVSQIWLCNRSLVNFLTYEENLIFFFIRVRARLAGNRWPEHHSWEL